jgi:hypothetical protein
MPLDLGKGIFNLKYRRKRSHRIYHATARFRRGWGDGEIRGQGEKGEGGDKGDEESFLL